MPDINETIDGLGKAFEEFKKANDANLKQRDVVLEEKMARLDAAMNAAEDAKAAIEAEAKRADEIEKRLNRMGLSGKGGSDDVEKELKSFNAIAAMHAAERKTAFTPFTAETMGEYKAGFETFMRKGDRGFFDAERKSMSVGSDPDGGYLVPADMAGRMIAKVYELSPIRAIAAVQPISSDALEGMLDNGEAGYSWTGESTTRSETDTPQVGKWRIAAEEIYAYPKTTRKLLDDAAVDVAAWLERKAADRFARAEGAAFIAGNGIAKPRGFTTYTTAATADSSRSWGVLEHKATANNGDFASSSPADILIDVVEALKGAYRNGARWVTTRAVIAKIRKFKESTTNAYLWQPGLQAGQPSTLLGYPVVNAEDMPTLATGSLSMAFGNFAEGYQIVDRLGMRAIRDEVTAPGFVKFHVFRRVGGDVVNFEAIKLIKFGS